MTERRPATRIAFISPCGYGNLGDVAIQDAFLDQVRHELAPVEVVGITQNPSDTAARHGVRAVPMDVDGFRLRSKVPPRLYDDAAVEPPTSPPSWPAALVKRMIRAGKEVLHWGIALREMRRADILAVSGGGQLDDHWGGPWLVPYALWKWTLAAKLLRTRVVFLSVGAGTTDSRMTRYFLRSALGRAQYASFRDERTVDRVRTQRLSSSARVVPDLAFGHRGRAAERPARNGNVPTIVLSPMAYLDPLAWPAKDAYAYRSSIERTADLARRLVERGFCVVLCTSDTPDIKTAEEVYCAASEFDGGGPGRGVLELADTRSLPELLDRFRGADVVIASRLHGVILANVVGTPSIALSYDWKVDEHMRVMGLEQYTFPVGSFDPEEVVWAVVDMLARRKELASAIAETCARFSEIVKRQYSEALRAIAHEEASSAHRA
jgi:polysaccharide pyruvyl transferase WcaK-like protein